MSKYRNYYGSTKSRLFVGDTSVNVSLDKTGAKAMRKMLATYLKDGDATDRVYLTLYPKQKSKKTGMNFVSATSMKTLSARG